MFVNIMRLHDSGIHYANIPGIDLHSLWIVKVEIILKNQKDDFNSLIDFKLWAISIYICNVH